MKDHTFNFWQKWLTYANVMAIGVGILAAFAGNSIVFELHNEYTKQVFFNKSEFNPDVLKLKKLAFWNYRRNNCWVSYFNDNDIRKFF